MIRVVLSKKLGELRWNQAMLARVTNIRPSTINNLFHDLADRISFEHLDKICEALECDITDIIEYIPNEPHTQKNDKATTKKV